MGSNYWAQIIGLKFVGLNQLNTNYCVCSKPVYVMILVSSIGTSDSNGHWHQRDWKPVKVLAKLKLQPISNIAVVKEIIWKKYVNALHDFFPSHLQFWLSCLSFNVEINILCYNIHIFEQSNESKPLFTFSQHKFRTSPGKILYENYHLHHNDR